MHRLDRAQLLQYRKRLEADRKAYGYVLQCFQSIPNRTSSETVHLIKKVSARYYNRILLRQVARVCEYEILLKRLEELS